MAETVVMEGAAFKGFVLSEDGQRVMINFAAEHPPVGADPEKAAVQFTVPTSSVPVFWLHLTALMDSLVAAGALPKSVERKPARAVASWQVGKNTMNPGYTAILLDEGLTSEALLVIPDVSALQIADAIEMNVLDHLPAEMQKEIMRQVEAKNGRKPRIIVPGKG